MAKSYMAPLKSGRAFEIMHSTMICFSLAGFSSGRVLNSSRVSNNEQKLFQDSNLQRLIMKKGQGHFQLLNIFKSCYRSHDLL